MTDIVADRLSFWDSRAELGLAAGSNDLNLKAIEIAALDSLLPAEGNILDAGCGNAYTLVELCSSRQSVRMSGFDYSSQMIRQGKEYIDSKGFSSRISISRQNLLSIDSGSLGQSPFDHIYTQRSLINLDSFEDQLCAIKSLWQLLRPGGTLLLCESFVDGLNEINNFRKSINLGEIMKPWHNTYFSLDSLEHIASCIESEFKVHEFSGSYYFVSRVVNAWQASQRGEDPSYSDPSNIMSLDLPPLDVCGQSKLISFEKSL